MRAQFHHQPHLVHQPQEVVGLQEAAAGVAPAGQGLEAGQLAGGEAHDGLEEGHDLAATDGAAQVGFQGQAGQAVAFQGPAVGGGGRAAAAGLGRLHSKFRPAQQLGRLLGVVAALGAHGADGEGGQDVEAGHAQGLLQGLAQDLGVVAAADGGHDRELVLADAGHQGLAREGGGQAGAQRRQHQVGALVTQGLVEAAKAVEVGDHQFVVARFDQPLAGAGDEAAAVEQAGEGVGLGADETGLARGDAGGAQALLQPDAAP